MAAREISDPQLRPKICANQYVDEYAIGAKLIRLTIACIGNVPVQCYCMRGLPVRAFATIRFNSVLFLPAAAGQLAGSGFDLVG